MAKNRAKISGLLTPILSQYPSKRPLKNRLARFPRRAGEKTVFDPPESPLRELERKFEAGLSRPRISVVIVNHNGVEALWNCLFALKTQTYPPYEVILVDNASEDASVSFVRTNYPLVHILECQEDFGPAMGLNLGIKTATGHLVVLLDLETVVTPDWLGRMVRDFQKTWPKFGILTAQARLGQEGKGSHRTLNILGNPVEGFFPDPTELFCPGGGAVLFPRFLAPDGPFDADYFFCREDAYLGWKFRLSNHATGISTEAKVFQNMEKPTPDYPEWKAVYYENRNRWLNLLLFYETGNLLKVMPWAVMEGMARLARSLGVGFGPFWGTFCAVVWIGLHPRFIHKKRRAIQEKRKVRDRAILRRLSGRVARDGGAISRVLNFLSLAYCAMVGLEVMEMQEWEF